jgi:hypothetical protein
LIVVELHGVVELPEPQAALGPLNTNSTARGFVIASEDRVMKQPDWKRIKMGALSFSKQMLPLRPAGSGVHNSPIKLVIKQEKSLQIFFNYSANSSDSSKCLASMCRPGEAGTKAEARHHAQLVLRKAATRARYLKKRERHVLQKGCPVLR